MSRRSSIAVSSLLLVAAMSLAGCTASGSAFSTAQSTAESQSEGPEEPSKPKERRVADSPLVAHTLPGVPFEVWAPVEAVGEDVAVLRGGPLVAEEGQLEELGAAQGDNPPELLTLLPEGSGFGVGIDPVSSLPEVGLLTPGGEFTSLASLPGISAPNYLPEGVPYQTLNATDAASAGDVVVWLSSGSGGDQWSLMAWDRTQGSLQELSSSASSSIGFTTIHPVLLPAGTNLSTNGTHAYFDASLPASIIEQALPGERLLQMQIAGNPQDSQVTATFEVSLAAPGDVVFVGKSIAVTGDIDRDSAFFAAVLEEAGTELSGDAAMSGEAAVQEEPQSDGARLREEQQSGMDLDWQPEPGPWGFDLSRTCEMIKSGCESRPVRSVLWADDEGMEPVFAIGDADLWQYSSLDASQGYLAVGVTPIQDDQQSAWILVWDLQAEQVVAALQTQVTPIVRTSGNLVLWSGPAIVTLPGDQSPSVWQIGTENSRVLPDGPGDAGPRVSDDIIAVRTVDDMAVANWTFLQWHAK